jgi:hypothetical protein
VGDACRAGTCEGTPRTCPASDDPCTRSTCDETAGACVTAAEPDGTACDDGNRCTRTDACLKGRCTGSDPVVCTAADQCHGAGTCEPATGRCSSPARADGTACDDGDACTELDACVAGRCGGQVSPDNDGDGLCDTVDLCPHVSDPSQTDDNGDGIGDACQCSAPAPGNCIAGGGSKRTDCLIEFASTGPLSFNRRGTKLKNELRCTDGDPACDLDGARNGTCRFGVAPCFANLDPRFPRCTPSSIGSIEVSEPSATTSKSVSGRANAERLEDALASLGLEVVRRGEVLAERTDAVGGNRCAALIALETPAGHALGKKGPFKQKFVLKVQSMTGRRDKDNFVLVCD